MSVALARNRRSSWSRVEAERDGRWRSLEKRTWVAKVCSKTDSASSLAGVQLEGGCAPTFPDVTWRNSFTAAVARAMLVILGSRAADPLLPQPDWLAGLCNLLRSVFKLFKLGRIEIKKLHNKFQQFSSFLKLHLCNGRKGDLNTWNLEEKNMFCQALTSPIKDSSDE